ncbi:MAG: ABC transporter ATP-binding protein [Clostridium argentinense]|uniref:ABC transporter ATP-binding protein n=1 Tax=Clostridium faecium TaxID=2762223 RepID=A0ABR8YT79_9CLOT|nr:ABC transporter ATP-binding protein [Clostridium faecium]MBD8047171.1 ABC transporter ATP-binding protein [Clostridium faecium]MBS5822709.1 ABC transporter ATP-binding protein [Clostridium argentinense]MDU1348449.1 ABC transporter ATP-binding protein [Clostridium argentinense]
MDTLKISNLSKSYGSVQALDNVSFDINKGMYGLLGPNGAGKTTLMRTLTTLMPIEKGSISYGDILWDNENKIRKLIGYLPQHFSMYSNITVEEALKYIATLKNVKDSEIDSQIQFALEKTNLLDEKNKKIKELSGGMVRRLGIAQAIIGDPKILIVDEPTTGLDPERRIAFRNLLNRLGRDRIIIISTHIVEDIEATCDQVCVLNKGKVLYNGTVSDMRNIVKNKIYECIMTQEKFYQLNDSIKLISSKTIDDNKVIVRFIESKDSSNINDKIQVENVTLEDAYLYLVGDKNDK